MLTQVAMNAGLVLVGRRLRFTITSMFHLSKLSPSLAVGVSQFQQYVGMARFIEGAEASEILAAKLFSRRPQQLSAAAIAYLSSVLRGIVHVGAEQAHGCAGRVRVAIFSDA
jgi:hypothetical protein